MDAESISCETRLAAGGSQVSFRRGVNGRQLEDASRREDNAMQTRLPVGLI